MKIAKRIGILIGVIVVISLIIDYKSDIPFEQLKVKYEHPESKFMDIDGMPVHYRDEGNMTDTMPLVLIHGTSSSLHTWNECTEEWKKTHRVIRMDIPAFGLTGPNKENEYTWEGYAEFVDKVLKQLNVEHCCIVGNSLGGAIAWNYAKKYPEKTKKMILIDAGGYKFEMNALGFKLMQILGSNPISKPFLYYITPTFIVNKSVRQVYYDNEKIKPEAYERYLDFTLREGNRKGLVARMKIPNKSHSDEIKLLKTPALIIWGEHDAVIPLRCAYQFQEDLPNNELVIIKNSGHIPMEESPNEVITAVEEFLRDQQ